MCGSSGGTCKLLIVCVCLYGPTVKFAFRSRLGAVGDSWLANSFPLLRTRHRPIVVFAGGKLTKLAATVVRTGDKSQTGHLTTDGRPSSGLRALMAALVAAKAQHSTTSFQRAT